ncbi:MAG: hypothetical protein OXC40_05650, partial [Proteobacteria bacterium]|nr:hypothetical protein [Pseudomonadota bacterium]
LYEKIRTDAGLSYAPQSWYSNAEFGLSMIYASTSKPLEVLTLINQTLEKLATTPLESETLNNTKTYILSNYYRGLGTPISILRQMNRSLLYFNNLDYFLNYPKNISDVTVTDIQELAKQYLNKYKLALYGKKKLLADYKVSALVIP